MYKCYYPQGWKDRSKCCETAVSAAALNHMESGIATASALASGAILASITALLTVLFCVKR